MSARITTTMISRNILADLNRSADTLDRTRSKAASGKEITRPSDNPFAASRALKLRETLDGTRQHQRNAEDAIGWQESTEQALSEITDAGHRIRDLLIQAGTDTSDTVARAAIATELAQLISGVKEQANASYAGRFVFSGTNTTTAPYAAGADDSFHGNADAIVREIGPGVSMSINISGGAVLGNGADGKLLDVLRGIQDHLAANDGTALRGPDLAALDTQLDGLMGIRAQNGANSNRIDAALSRLDQFEETTNKQLSETEDADFAETMIELNSQQAAYQAALRAGANIVQSSLMDFLR